MKTKTRISGLLAILLSLFMFSATTATTTKKAPCPYKVTNTLGCPVTVTVRLVDSTCSALCATYMNVVIPSGGTYNIPCTGCSTICNIIVTVIKIGTTPVGLDATFSSGPIALSPCSATAINYDPSVTTFLIY